MRHAACGAFLADQAHARPAEHRDHLAQPAGVRAVQLFEPRMIFLIELAGNGELGTQRLVARLHVEKRLLE